MERNFRTMPEVLKRNWACVGLLILCVGPIMAEDSQLTPRSAVSAKAKLSVHEIASLQTPSPAVFRSPQSVCDGNWQAAPSMAYLDWLTGMEAYFTYQDPSQTGCTNTFPFGVVSVVWPIYVRVPTEIRLYPAIVGLDADSQSCTYPGLPICVGADTIINLTDTGFQTLEVFFHDTCCVPGPYFAAVVVDTFLDLGLVDIVVDSGGTPRNCASYNDFGHAPADLVTVSGFTNNLKLWSRGVNATQNQCFCCSGLTGNIDCDTGGAIDISDLSRLIDNLFISLSPLCCPAEANCDGQSGVDISDLSRLIDFLYISFNPLAPC
jgi:hypothetical protein